MPVLHLHAAAAAGSRADRLDGKIYGDVTCLLEFQECRHMLALFKRLFQSDEHDVKTTGAELHRRARLDFNTVAYRTHLHHAVVHAHGMDFKTRRNVRRAADQTVWRSASIGNGHISATNGSP